MRLVIALLCACSTTELRGLDPPAPVAVESPNAEVPNAVFDDVVALGDVIARDNCATRVMGAPFRGARMLCLAATSMALVAVALDDPRRAAAIATQLEALIGHAQVATRTEPRNVLFRGLLGIMLVGLHRIATPALKFTTLLDELAAALAHDLEGGFIASYVDRRIWPCDHAPAAAFLRLHGTLRDSASTRAADVLADRLRSALATKFPTEVDARGRIVDGSERTTTLAFAASYLLAAEPALAREFAERVVTHCDRVPLAACREWTTGRHRADAASGPLVGEFAIGATALAIIATRALPDLDWNAGLLRTAGLAGEGSIAPRSLEAALLAWGRVARSW